MIVDDAFQYIFMPTCLGYIIHNKDYIFVLLSFFSHTFINTFINIVLTSLQIWQHNIILNEIIVFVFSLIDMR